MTRRFNHFLGKAGHLAVMSEFLIRGWNVAIPEVDIGDDIFVVHDKDGTLERVQVKSATARQRANGFSAQFTVPMKQLTRIANPPFIHYVFIARLSDSWSRPVIVLQDALLRYVNSMNMGAKAEGKVNFYFAFDAEQKTVICSGLDLSRHIADFSDFPILEH